MTICHSEKGQDVFAEMMSISKEIYLFSKNVSVDEVWRVSVESTITRDVQYIPHNTAEIGAILLLTPYFLCVSSWCKPALLP